MMYKKCGCGKKIEYYTECCEECKKDREERRKEIANKYDKEIRYSKENMIYHKFYNSKSWRTLANIVMQHHNGLCLMCWDYNSIRDANVVHHIEELKDAWDERLKEDNLVPLCHACHNNIHADYNESKKIYLKNLKNKIAETI